MPGPGPRLAGLGDSIGVMRRFGYDDFLLPSVSEGIVDQINESLARRRARAETAEDSIQYV